MDLMKKRWHRYHYKNLTYLTISIIVAFFLVNNQSFRNLLFQLGKIGYFGAFIGGILFVSTFTVSIGTVILFFLAESLNPLEIGVIAGLGAVLSDLTIFHFIRNRGLISEIKHFFDYFGGDKLSYLLHTKYFSWTLPVMGALIIASPLPDELGVGLMGISKMKTINFIFLSFILNSIGIFLIVSAATFLKM
jgi:hypothetical protein